MCGSGGGGAAAAAMVVEVVVVVVVVVRVLLAVCIARLHGTATHLQSVPSSINTSHHTPPATITPHMGPSHPTCDHHIPDATITPHLRPVDVWLHPLALGIHQAKEEGLDRGNEHLRMRVCGRGGKRGEGGPMQAMLGKKGCTGPLRASRYGPQECCHPPLAHAPGCRKR